MVVIAVGRYRKKPVVIEAVQFIDNVDGIADVLRFVPNGLVGLRPTNDGTLISVKTPTGWSQAKAGDWIGHQVVNGKDDYWPIAGDVFEQTYEATEEEFHERS